MSKLELFWEKQCTGDASVAPKWDYSTTLFEMVGPPNRTLSKDEEDLNHTALVNPETYLSQYNALTAVQRENVVESSFG